MATSIELLAMLLVKKPEMKRNMAIEFKPTRSYIYHAARYELLPRIVEMVSGLGDEPFSLLEILYPLLEQTYTPEQLETPIKRAESDKTNTARQIFAFYVPFLARKLEVFEKLGGGKFRNVSNDADVAEADSVATDVDSDDSGIIYAYSFPTIMRASGRFPIKVGLTTGDDANASVTQQCKQTCCFEFPVVLNTWKVQRVAAVEDAIHATLEARGSKREAPGTEWFDTTVVEIESIVNFVQPAIPDSGP